MAYFPPPRCVSALRSSLLFAGDVDARSDRPHPLAKPGIPQVVQHGLAARTLLDRRPKQQVAADLGAGRKPAYAYLLTGRRIHDHSSRDIGDCGWLILNTLLIQADGMGLRNHASGKKQRDQKRKDHPHGLSPPSCALVLRPRTERLCPFGYGRSRVVSRSSDQCKHKKKKAG